MATATIARLIKVRYDERTDVIEPVRDHRGPNNVWLGEMRRLLAEVGWQIVEPVTGWAPYTHLIRYGEAHDIDTWGYCLAELR